MIQLHKNYTHRHTYTHAQKEVCEGKQQTITTGEDIYSFTLYISPQLPPIRLYLRKKKKIHNLTQRGMYYFPTAVEEISSSRRCGWLWSDGGAVAEGALSSPLPNVKMGETALGQKIWTDVLSSRGLRSQMLHKPGSGKSSLSPPPPLPGCRGRWEAKARKVVLERMNIAFIPPKFKTLEPWSVTVKPQHLCISYCFPGLVAGWQSLQLYSTPPTEGGNNGGLLWWPGQGLWAWTQPL